MPRGPPYFGSTMHLQSLQAVVRDHPMSTVPRPPQTRGSQASLEPPETKCLLRPPEPLVASDAQRRQFENEVALLHVAQNAAQRFRHSGWRVTRERVYRAMIRTGQPDSRRRNYRDCGAFAYVLRSCEAPYKYRTAGSACHDRLCTPCATARARQIARNVIARSEGKRIRFATLTIATDGMTLTEAIEHLYASFKRLRKDDNWKGRVTGGVAFLETKFNPETDRWHPHLHCLLEGRFFAQAVLSAAWKAASNGSQIVDIRQAHKTESVARYVTKYASKPMDGILARHAEQLDEAVIGLKGVRLCTTFGTWRGVSLTGKQDEDGWEQLMPLGELFRRAAQGDASMTPIMNALGERAWEAIGGPAEARPPPEPTVSEWVAEQRKLFPMGTWHR